MRVNTVGKSRKLQIGALVGVVLMMFFGVITMTQVVIAAGGQGGGGGAGGTDVNGCEAGTYTSYPGGAAWKWYSTNSDSVSIKGWDKDYAKPGTITGCKETGGYWRYAFVMCADMYGLKKGDQIGLKGIGTGYISSAFGGGLYYNTTYADASWDTVAGYYAEAQKNDPATHWRKWEKGSDLAWFCSPNPNKPTQYRTTSSASGGTTITVGGSANLTFTHKTQADRSGISISSTTAKSQKSEGWDKSGVTSSFTSGTTSKTNNTSGSASGGWYTASTYTNKYKVTIIKAGTYKFCETVSIASQSKSSEDCTTVTVVDYRTTSSASDDRRINVGGTINLTFTHNSQATKSGMSITSTTAKAEKSKGWDKTGVSATRTSGSSGKTDSTGSTASSGWYTASSYTNVYSITINQAGTYEFCESASIASPYRISSDCATVTVVDYKTNSSSSGGGEVRVVGSKNLTFNHTTHATVSGVSVGSSISRIGDWSKAGVTYTMSSGTTTKTDNSGGSASGGWYQASSYTNTYAITFSAPGEYTFCETVTISGTNSGYGRSSESCQTITAVAYYSSTDVNNGKGTADGTGIQLASPASNTFVTKTLGEVTLAVGDTISPSFTHKTYSSHIRDVESVMTKTDSKNGDDTDWVVTLKSGNLASRTITANTKDGNYYRADTQTNNYEVAFYGAGYYTLCEDVKVIGVNSTKGCAQYKAVYNFKNTANVEVKDTVYAGETVGLKSAGVGITQNDTNYNATIAKGATVKLIAFTSTTNQSGNTGRTAGSGVNTNLCNLMSISSNDAEGPKCVEAESKTGEELRKTGVNEYFKNATYNVFDTRAGDYMCFTLAVWPANFTGISFSGSESWALSNISCAKIAKRPKFEIYGGSLYSAGSVNTSIAKKNNLLGDSNFPFMAKYVGSQNAKSYGSRVEQSVVTLGLNKWLASGAAGVGGTESKSSEQIFCEKWTALSFANYSTASFINSICSSSSTAAATGQSGISTNLTEGGVLAEYWAARTNNVVRTEGNYTVSANENLTGTQVIKVGGNVTINGNLKYSVSSMTGYTAIPKLIIYGKNITIACHVTRVDAILIAENTVNTCDNSDVNSEARSNQLTINGAIIAKELKLNRTYGAGNGSSSDIPAEIINYDSSMTIWSQSGRTNDATEAFVTTYQHELAPRY
ncbi:MAG: hypothetical protein Q4B34_01190 [Candidatus Saccharibacteria bacterium]|nr:hypothetical protein [Candidatus Saccharibacteria bacterium]